MATHRSYLQAIKTSRYRKAAFAAHSAPLYAEELLKDRLTDLFDREEELLIRRHVMVSVAGPAAEAKKSGEANMVGTEGGVAQARALAALVAGDALEAIQLVDDS